MKRLYTAFLLAGILCTGAPAVMAGGASSGHEQLLQQAERLLSSYKDNEALLLYEQVLTAAPDNIEALCKATLLHCRIGERYQDETFKAKHYLKAKLYAQQAYELNPDDAESNYAMALALGSEAMISGPKQRLIGINELKTFVDAALAIDSSHAGAWHIMGRWYYKMANLNLAEKVASKVFFGGICGEATNEAAASALEQAILYDPSNIRFYYELACIYDEMKASEAYKITLEKAVALTFETREELELSRRCKIMLQQHQKI
jgi:tetratricopeptide (TPR) repeat protein